MALGDERRASGAAMEQARRQGGRNMEQSRRAGGSAMIAERRGDDIVTDLLLLQGTQQQRRTLPPVGAVGGVPAKRGRGTYDPAKAGHSGGGIASPLTESSAATREYWPAGLTSSDGLFVLPAIKKLSLTDANGAAVVVELANPAGGA